MRERTTAQMRTRDRWLLAAISTILVVVAVGVSSSYLRVETRPVTPTPPVTPGAVGCGSLDLVRPGPFQILFDQARSCYQGSPNTSATIEFAWVAPNFTANVAASWNCLGNGCVVMQPNTLYNDSGVAGAFNISLTSLGPRWIGVSAIEFSLWASPATSPGHNLTAGQSIEVIGEVQ